MARFAAVLGACAFLGSCGAFGACTEIGCSDQLTLTIAPDERPWPQGKYTLRLTLDGQTHVCEFAFPSSAPATSIVEIPCTPRASVQLEPSAVCSETKHPDGSRSESCVPVPDRAKLRASFLGTPAQVAVTLVHDETELLSQQHQIRYRSERPNGPNCDPVCRQAGLELSWP